MISDQLLFTISIIGLVIFGLFYAYVNRKYLHLQRKKNFTVETHAHMSDYKYLDREHIHTVEVDFITDDHKHLHFTLNDTDLPESDLYHDGMLTYHGHHLDSFILD